VRNCASLGLAVGCQLGATGVEEGESLSEFFRNLEPALGLEPRTC
jgi:hypothetical protein